MPLTQDQIMNCREFWHVTLKDSRGNPLRVRRSGRTLTWVTRPGEFRIPVKHGLYESTYITHRNAAEWIAAKEE